MLKRLASRRAAWGEALVLAVIGGVPAYLKPVIGIPILVILLVLGLYLIWSASKREQKEKVQQATISHQLSTYPEAQKMSRTEYKLWIDANNSIFTNHDHDDMDWTLAEFLSGKTWEDIVKGTCHCGKPRNQKVR